MLQTFNRASFAVGFAILTCLLLISSATAQTVGATLSGTVADPSGSVIPNAQITLRNTGTAEVTTVASNSQGFYSAPNLQPGDYILRTSAAGFAPSESHITLDVGAQPLVNVSLAPGAVTQSVEVRDTPAAIELASSQISDVVDAQTVRELPLNGRDWTQLATLQPGVAAVRTEKAVAVGADRGNRGYGVQITISGARPQQNNYRLDGISINDYSNGAPGSVVGLNLGVDAIQEFSVVTSNYSAEYGRTSGGVINAISRAGTNNFHGSVYEFLRNSALDARNFFDLATIPPFKRNQFGASAGGPIIKDRTFIFGDYEGLRQSQGFTNPVGQVPSAAGIATANPAIQPFLVLYPQPNGALHGVTGDYSFVGTQITPEDFFTVRADHKVSEKGSLHGSYMFDNGTFTQPDSLNDIFLQSHTRRQSGSVEITHTFTPTFINTVRGGISRVFANINGSQPGPVAAANDPKLGVVPGQNAPSIITGGLLTFGGGVNGPSAFKFGWTSFQAYDDAFLTKGIHFLKFGFAFERMRNNILALSNPSGLFRFNNVADFFNAQPNEFDASLPGTTSPRNLRQNLFGGYVQDDIHFRPYLTFNVGLRYEMTTVPTEVNGKLSTLLNLTDAQPHLGDPYYSNPTTKNFEPRVGFAWDPFHTGTTSIRGAFGLFDNLPLPYEFELLSSLAAPFLELGSITGVSNQKGVFPNAFPLISASASSLRQTYIQPNPSRNYVMEWNINLERQIVRNLTASVGYVGTRGVHQPFRSDDVNSVQPAPGTLLWPAVHNSGAKLNLNAGQIAALYWTGHSYYDGLQLQVVKRMSLGFQTQSSFTYSKAIDDGSATLAGDPFGNSISGLFPFSEASRRGPADFNIGKNFVQNLIWTVPTARSWHGPLGWAANGWEVGGIFQASDGLPFTPLLAGDVLGLKDTAPYDVPDRVPGCAPTGLSYSINSAGKRQVQYLSVNCFTAPTPFNRLGNVGRNSVMGPGLKDLDFSLFKNNKIPAISENFNVQFRAEFFNILNFTNFAPPSSGKTLFSAAFDPKTNAFLSYSNVAGQGLETSTQTTSRQIQFALKLSW